ncbi:TetR/AcrR family transcriptional regulator [Fredinandcohnia sp. QZ13]|uniref:TetR/AcrR family transcriptional regulator n=1 Tax=Fredinandcohnia sp. QZ13 TaxID=3073144 RepID=UPI00285340B8|nr:TetR/AcrR family transcriptional regulator [Fredinandcohnia sp. QZ13]MDR4887298.1 TetR/AcrR family transcriptional regulator [Fredinandcohnia sp. QZ13]
MSPRKQVQEELSREKIMDVAHELFVQKGYQHVSMRQIAKELNYSHGAIYYHFNNKADLFYAMVVQDFELLNQVLQQIINQDIPPDEKLKKILLGYIEFGLTHKSQYELMFLINDEEVKSCIQQEPMESYGMFANVISNLSNQKASIQDIWSIFLSIHGFVTHYCRSNQTYDDVKNLARSHVEYILKPILNGKV